MFFRAWYDLVIIRNMNSPKKNLPLYYVAQMPEEITLQTPVIILLHGIGGNEYQLFNFANELPADHLIVSVRAPFPVYSGSYTWFSVDFSVPSIKHDEAEKSRLLLAEFIDELCNLYKVKKKNVSVIGFSQGAIMGFSIGLTSPGLFGKLVALSGRILPETIESSILIGDSLDNLKVFVGHGIYDPTLPIKWAREAKSHLEQLPVNLVY